MGYTLPVVSKTLKVLRNIDARCDYGAEIWWGIFLVQFELESKQYTRGRTPVWLSKTDS